jgi:hypothetical protein
VTDILSFLNLLQQDQDFDYGWSHRYTNMVLIVVPNLKSIFNKFYYFGYILEEIKNLKYNILVLFLHTLVYMTETKCNFETSHSRHVCLCCVVFLGWGVGGGGQGQV